MPARPDIAILKDRFKKKKKKKNIQKVVIQTKSL